MTTKPESGGSGETAKVELTAEDFVERLRRALSKDGDFPASAKVVTELRMLASDPNATASQISEIILREPSLGTRVLHLVNSSFYRRARPIMTVSQAVVQIGMKPLSEMCAGLVLLQRFVPQARRGGPFANCLRKSIVTSILSSSISNETFKSSSRQLAQRNQESGYLAGSFSELGTLLLGYYFPNILENAAKRAEAKSQEIEVSIKQLTGLSPIEISVEVIKSLQLPSFYADVLMQTAKIRQPGKIPNLSELSGDIGTVVRNITAAQSLSEVVTSNPQGRARFDEMVQSLAPALGLDLKQFGNVIGNLDNQLREHCTAIEVDLPPLPEYLVSYSPEGDVKAGPVLAAPEDEDLFQHYLTEIRVSVQNHEPTASIITSVMETLAFCLKFDRVLLLLATPGKKSLAGRMLLGRAEGIDPTKISRPLGTEAPTNSPEAKAFALARPVFTGEPIFENGWPIAAIPIGLEKRIIGVVYADKAASRNVVELTQQEQAAIAVLTDLLDRAISAR